MLNKASTADTLRARIRSLMRREGWNETETARRLRDISKRWNQPRFHRCLKGEQDFSIDLGDLDNIAQLFTITIHDLFSDEFGQFERRAVNHDRRSGVERRQKRERIYTPIELSNMRRIIDREAAEADDDERREADERRARADGGRRASQR